MTVPFEIVCVVSALEVSGDAVALLFSSGLAILFCTSIGAFCALPPIEFVTTCCVAIIVVFSALFVVLLRLLAATAAKLLIVVMLGITGEVSRAERVGLLGVLVRAVDLPINCEMLWNFST